MSKPRSYTDQELIAAVPTSRSWGQVIAKLGLSSCGGGTYKSIQSHVRRLGLDVSHFSGQGWNRGDSHVNPARKIPIKDILVEHSTYFTSGLRKRLIDAGLKTWKCELCDNVEWMGARIPLQTDHINGINDDHRIENLRLLCPNCHAQTDNWCGKNKKS